VVAVEDGFAATFVDVLTSAGFAAAIRAGVQYAYAELVCVDARLCTTVPDAPAAGAVNLADEDAEVTAIVKTATALSVTSNPAQTIFRPSIFGFFI
jgi:hypothetical protein